jgi:hypothetical protein
MIKRWYKLLVAFITTSVITVPVLCRASSAASLCGQYNRIALYGHAPTVTARHAAITKANGLDFYTGKSFTGPIEVDHVYALASAASTTCTWTFGKRSQFANDPLELVATSRSINRQKSDLGPAEWSPINRASACAYGRRYEAVAIKWHLPLSTLDHRAILLAC